jgi:hypothetical protein
MYVYMSVCTCNTEPLVLSTLLHTLLLSAGKLYWELQENCTEVCKCTQEQRERHDMCWAKYWRDSLRKPGT